MVVISLRQTPDRASPATHGFDFIRIYVATDFHRQALGLLVAFAWLIVARADGANGISLLKLLCFPSLVKSAMQSRHQLACCPDCIFTRLKRFAIIEGASIVFIGHRYFQFQLPGVFVTPTVVTTLICACLYNV